MCIGFAQRDVQSVADAERAVVGGLHGVEDDLFAAGLEPGQVAGVELGGFAQDLDCVGLADKSEQTLARMAPVDQEENAPADAFEGLVEG